MGYSTEPNPAYRAEGKVRGRKDRSSAGWLAVTRLHVESGVGELNLDLSGKLERNVMAFIKSGIGDTTLRLPQDVGVRVQSSVGIGSLQPHGLAWDGRAYTNNLYGRNAVTLDITIKGGMGKISLI